MNPTHLLQYFERIAEAPGGVSELRSLIIYLAVSGKLVPQEQNAEPGEDFYHRVQNGIEQLAAKCNRCRWNASEPITLNAAPVNLPEAWTLSRLNDTGLYINGIAFKPADWKNAGLPIIRIQNLSDPTKEFNYTEGKFPDENIVRDGDLLVSWSATLDAFIWRRREGVLNQHIFKVILNEEAVLRDYLYWLLKHEIRKLAESDHAHGLAMKHINRGPFLAHVVSLPPLAEQQRIVAKVDELMALCDRFEVAQGERESRRDRLVASSLNRLNNGADPDAFRDHARFYFNHLPRLTTKPEHIQQLRHTILNLAVRGKLVPQDPSDEPASELLKGIEAEKSRLVKEGALARQKLASCEPKELTFDCPMNWQAVNFNDVCNLVTSGSRGWAEFYSETGPKFIRAQNIRFGRLRLEDLACVSLPKKAEGTRTQVSKGDLLIVITGAGVTNPAMLDHELGEAYVSQHVALIKPTATSLSRWLLLCLMAPVGARAELVERAYGAGKPGLNLDNIRSLRIPVPPIAEQQRIVAKVDELMALCNRLETQLTTTQTESRCFLEAVLHEAVAAVI